MEIASLSNNIKQLALRIGFHKVGIAQAQVLPQSGYLKEWLNQGHHGKMSWMENYLDKRLDVGKLYPEAESVLVVGHNYYTPPQHSGDASMGKISRYAWGRDYHKIIKKKLKQLLIGIQQLDSGIEGRIFTDTAPLQEKLWAQQAGIGWQGKSTNILSREFGSWLFLGEIVINKPLLYDQPAIDHCGNCTACLTACPTNALEPFRLNASRCISYLTIELWDEPISEPLAGKLNNWIFGCDICQDVCPWNRFAKETDEPAYQPIPENIQPSLAQLAAMSADEFARRFGKSAVKRAKYKNFLRNIKACAVR